MYDVPRAEMISNPIHQLQQILDTLKEVLYVERENRHLLRRLLGIVGPLTASIAIEFSGDSMNNALTLNVGQTSTASIVPLLADGVTPSGGTVSGVSYSFSDPSATVSLNPDGVTALVTGVAASTGPVGGTAACTVTDTDGVVSTWSQGFSIETNAAAPPPAQTTESIAVQFTAPASPLTPDAEKGAEKPLVLKKI
jgi:hypothetical protein